jgi:hypothetical protein
VDSNNYLQGQTVTVLGNPGNLVRAGYIWNLVWNTQANGSGTSYNQGQLFVMGSANVTLYAQWLVVYTVTYNGNGATGGTVPVDNNSYYQGQSVGLLGNTGNLVRIGYNFVEWNTQANGGGTAYIPNQVFVMGSANVVLYAVWSSWTAQTLSSTQCWKLVTYGNGVFVAIDSPMGTGSGIANTAATSSNGVSWTANNLPSSQTWVSVTYGNGVFVAIANLPISLGGTNVAATSPNGVTWTARTLPNSLAWTSVTYGNGTFVAISDGSASGVPGAATSPDGVTWTPQTLPGIPNGQGWGSVTYGNGTFVAVSSTSTAATSPDGVTWTAQTVPSGLGSVTYGNGTFVALATGYGNVAATSPDGVTWTAQTLPSSSGWTSVTYGNTFVAVSSINPNGSTAAATSPNGVTWTQSTLPSSQNWNSVTYGNGTFVAVSGNANYGSNVAATATSP